MKSEQGYILPLILFGILVLLSGIGLVGFFYYYKAKSPVSTSIAPKPFVSTESTISDFDSCVSAGNPVQESFPRTCNANGISFRERLLPTPSPATDEANVVDGTLKLCINELANKYGEGSYISGELLVGFKDGVSKEESVRFVETNQLIVKSDSLFESLKALHLTVSVGSEFEIICRLQQSPLVKYIEPNFVTSTSLE